jgi:signal transduction histidine kinase
VRSPTLAGVLTIPLLSFLYIGPSSRLRLAVMAQFVVSALIFVGVNKLFEPPPLTMLPVAIQALGLVSTTAAALYVAMMALFYANALASQVELKAEMEGHLRTTADLVGATESARRSSAAKAEFIAKMSHELRTPLNAVIGYSEILLDEAETEADAQSAADLKRIHGAGVHLLKLVNEILDLSRIEAGRMENFPEFVDCGDLLRAATGRFEDAAQQNGNKIQVDAAAAPGAIFVDAAKLGQILDQLLENAVAFTRDGDVCVRAERIGRGEHDLIRISVADTGCGISAERLDGFLDRLETVEEADGRQEGGAGVGLLLCKRLCELIGAGLSLQSEQGRGTRVTVELTMTADAASVMESAELAGARLGAVAEQMRRAESAEQERRAHAKVALG